MLQMTTRCDAIAFTCACCIAVWLVHGPSVSYIAWKTGMKESSLPEVVIFGTQEIMFWTSLGMWPWDKTTVASLPTL